MLYTFFICANYVGPISQEKCFGKISRMCNGLFWLGYEPLTLIVAFFFVSPALSKKFPSIFSDTIQIEFHANPILDGYSVIEGTCVYN